MDLGGCVALRASHCAKAVFKASDQQTSVQGGHAPTPADLADHRRKPSNFLLFPSVLLMYLSLLVSVCPPLPFCSSCMSVHPNHVVFDVVHVPVSVSPYMTPSQLDLKLGSTENPRCRPSTRSAGMLVIHGYPILPMPLQQSPKKPEHV